MKQLSKHTVFKFGQDRRPTYYIIIIAVVILLYLKAAESSLVGPFLGDTKAVAGLKRKTVDS